MDSTEYFKIHGEMKVIERVPLDINSFILLMNNFFEYFANLYYYFISLTIN